MELTYEQMWATHDHEKYPYIPSPHHAHRINHYRPNAEKLAALLGLYLPTAISFGENTSEGKLIHDRYIFPGAAFLLSRSETALARHRFGVLEFLSRLALHRLTLAA